MTGKIKKFFSYLCFLLCLTLIDGRVVLCHAQDNSAKTVKVGFFNFDGYHEQDSNGVRFGYGYDFLQHIAGYANLKYEYIGYDKSWGEMQEMLANGEIDLLTSAQKTTEREAVFDFSQTNIGVSSAILTTKANDSRYMLNDYRGWDGIRVGMINGNSRNDSFEEFAFENEFSFVPVYYSDVEDMIEELKSSNTDKKIDAILTSNLRRIEDEQIIAQFDSSPFYAIVRKGETKLLSDINSAIIQMDNFELGWRTKLMNKYYAPPSNSGIIFSLEEQEYINSMQGTIFKALINPDRAPYSMIKDGQLTGIVYDIANQVIAHSGLNIEFIKIENGDDYWNTLTTGLADICFDVGDSYNEAEKHGYWLTNSYMTVPVAQLYLRKTSEFKTAAVPFSKETSDNYLDTLKDKGLEVVCYSSVSEAIHAVENGEQDVAFLPMESATLAARNDVRNKLVSEEVFGDVVTNAIAVNSNQSQLLYSIINKSVLSLNAKDIDTKKQNYTIVSDKPFSLLGYIYQYPFHFMLAVFIILCFITMAVVLIMIQKQRRKERIYLSREQKQNEILTEALNSAEKADIAKSQFLSRVSHEMRTPLNAIIGFIELAKDGDAENTASCLASSNVAAKQLLSVINDVLDMSSIESGKLKISSATFNFKHLITAITNLYGTQCKQKGITFETKINTHVDEWLIGDELRINQILMNLLGNAVKFTSEGYIHLTISQTTIKENKVFIRLIVSDSGCGMSEQMKSRLFKPFEQESASTARQYGGSGLGLSIVKSLVGMMQGKITVESSLGQGTSFTIDLPFIKGDISQHLSLPKQVEKLHILVVDDEASEREYITLVLSRIGVRFTVVADGKSALRELAQSDNDNDLYNVCLIDWRMPELSGCDITSQIRKRYGDELIVIVVSAYDFQKAGETATQAGANLFLSKPLFQSSLFDLFMTLTNGSISKPEEEATVWDFTGYRVLLAEDNTLNQIVAKGYLAKYNIVVDIAADGQQAVQMFTSSETGYYNAILMDIQMPLMDGYEATKVIRNSSHPQAQTISIIAQSADAFNEDISRCLAAGMNSHISKPIKPDILAKTLFNSFNHAEE